MKKQIFIILTIFSFVSCGPKKYSDYSPEEFYEAQGVVTYTKVSSKDLGTRKTYIQYGYNFEKDTIFTGYESNLDYYIVKGQPIVVLVHKKSPKINFFARPGMINENIWAKGFKMIEENEKNK